MPYVRTARTFAKGTLVINRVSLTDRNDIVIPVGTRFRIADYDHAYACIKIDRLGGLSPMPDYLWHDLKDFVPVVKLWLSPSPRRS